MVKRDQDNLSLCNPTTKIPNEVFVAAVCVACNRPECFRSAYVDNATQAKIEHNTKIGQYVNPEEVPPSPLSYYPDEQPGVDAAHVAPTEGTPRPRDPWEAPKEVRYIDYREIQNPKDDPWSVEYEGPRELRIKPGESVTLTGARKNGPTKKAR